MPPRSMRHQAARRRRRTRVRFAGAAAGLAAAAGGAYLLGGHTVARYLAGGFAATGARTAQAAAVIRTATPCATAPAAPSPATPPPLTACPPAPGRVNLSPPAQPAASGRHQPGRAGAGGTAVPGPSAGISPADAAAAQQVLTLINQTRILHELPPLALSPGLSRSAAAHTALMGAGCGLSHQCPGEPPLGDRETAAGVHWTAAAENIGEGGPEPATPAAIARMAITLTQDMLNEHAPADGHRRNLLSAKYRHIGIAVIRDRHGTVWITQDFAS